MQDTFFNQHKNMHFYQQQWGERNPFISHSYVSSPQDPFCFSHFLSKHGEREHSVQANTLGIQAMSINPNFNCPQQNIANHNNSFDIVTGNKNCPVVGQAPVHVQEHKIVYNPTTNVLVEDSKQKRKLKSPKKPRKKREKKELSIKKSKLRQMGQSYVTAKGVLVPAKSFKYVSCKCLYKCEEKLSFEDRRNVFDLFWNLGNWHDQSIFIANCTSVNFCKRQYVRSKTKNRDYTIKYFLNSIQVCKNVFVSTLNISSKRVEYCLKIKCKDSEIPAPDKRGTYRRKKEKEEEPQPATIIPKAPVETKRRDSSVLLNKKGKYVKQSELRQSGLEYTSAKGVVMPAKEFKFIDCKCFYKCSENLNVENRKKLFDEFWDMANWYDQSTFIAKSTFIAGCKRQYKKNKVKNRDISIKYYLNNVQVCKNVFIGTLAVSSKRVDYCLKIKCKESELPDPDKRGTYVRKKKERKAKTFSSKKKMQSPAVSKESYNFNDRGFYPMNNYLFPESQT